MAQMIKGTSIELLSASDIEIVDNVLIGEPAYTEINGCRIPTFTISVPKGDEHNWLDRQLQFFNMRFRTVGYPEQGMEENIPLCWNKKIKAELLNVTGDCTLYEKNTFTRHVFKDVFFYDGRGQKTTKTGGETVGEVSVHIYGCCHDNSYRPRAGDMLVEGECTFEFDVSNEKAVSESWSEFRKSYPEFVTIKTVNRKVYGFLPDYEIIA